MFTHRLVRHGPRDRLRARGRHRNHRLSQARALCVEPLEERQMLSAVALGDEFEVAALDSASSEGLPQLAHDAAGNFIVVWTDPAALPSGRGVLAQRYDASGAPQDDAIVIDATGRAPTVAMNDVGEFVVAWRSGEILARRYDASGSPLGDAFVVNSFTTGSQNSPSVAIDADGDFVVSWKSIGNVIDPEGHDRGIFAQRFDADGTPAGGEFRVSETPGGSRLTLSAQKVAMNALGQFAIAWIADDSGFVDHSIIVQQYEADGTPRGSAHRPFAEIDFSFSDAPIEISVGDRGDVVVAGVDVAHRIAVKRLSADGTPQGDLIQISPFSDLGFNELGFSEDSAGNFMLAWSTPDGVRAQRFSASGVPLEDQITVTTNGQDTQARAILDDQGHFTVASSPARRP